MPIVYRYINILLGFIPQLACFMATCLGFHQQGLAQTEDFSFYEIETRGSGCPEGSALVNLAEDGGAFTVSFANFIAASEAPEIKRERKNCRLVFKVKSAGKKRFSVIDYQMRGYAFAEKNATATVSVMIPRGPDETRHELVTETYQDFDSEFQINTRLVRRNRYWFGCDKSDKFVVNFVTKAASRRENNAYIALDSIDGESQHEFGIVWQSCQTPIAKPWIGSCELDLKRVKDRNKPKKLAERTVLVNAQAKTQAKLTEKLRKKIKRQCARKVEKNRAFHCKDARIDLNRCELSKI